MAITDLTNTKWILNNNWTASRGYGIFSVNLTYNNSNYTTFYIGHNPDLGAHEKNVIGFNDCSHFFSGEVITFTITGGTDVKHTSLISWFTSNATQIIEPEYTLRIDGVEVTDYENVIINGVSYKCKGKTLISFTVAGTSYQAEEGMTWAEWIASSYNTGGLYLDNSNSVSGNTLGLVSTDGNSSEKGTDVIVADYAYTYYIPGGGGSND